MITRIYNLDEHALVFKDADRQLPVTFCTSRGATMSLGYSDERSPMARFTTDFFPIVAYHCAIARLTPVLTQLVFLEDHTAHASSELCMSLAATVSNVVMMLGEASLVRSEDHISDLVPAALRDQVVIVSGPIGEGFITTVHFVKLRAEVAATPRDNATLWRPLAPGTVIAHRGREYKVCESVSMRLPFDEQPVFVAELRELQALLLEVATSRAIEEDEARARG